jgi:hypothetical protein
MSDQLGDRGTSFDIGGDWIVEIADDANVRSIEKELGILLPYFAAAGVRVGQSVTFSKGPGEQGGLRNYILNFFCPHIGINEGTERSPGLVADCCAP